MVNASKFNKDRKKAALQKEAILLQLQPVVFKMSSCVSFHITSNNRERITRDKVALQAVIATTATFKLDSNDVITLFCSVLFSQRLMSLMTLCLGTDWQDMSPGGWWENCCHQLMRSTARWRQIDFQPSPPDRSRTSFRSFPPIEEVASPLPSPASSASFGDFETIF